SGLRLCIRAGEWAPQAAEKHPGASERAVADIAEAGLAHPPLGTKRGGFWVYTRQQSAVRDPAFYLERPSGKIQWNQPLPFIHPGARPAHENSFEFEVAQLRHGRVVGLPERVFGWEIVRFEVLKDVMDLERPNIERVGLDLDVVHVTRRERHTDPVGRFVVGRHWFETQVLRLVCGAQV